MKFRHQPPEPARPENRFVDAGVNSAFVNAGGKIPEEVSDSADAANQSVPDKTIQPARDERGRFAQRNNRVRIKFVDPHFVFEETKERGLRLLNGISLAGTSVNQNSQADSARDKCERNKKHRLDQEIEIESRGFA